MTLTIQLPDNLQPALRAHAEAQAISLRKAMFARWWSVSLPQAKAHHWSGRN
jgi:hypothetical protein